MPNLWIGATLLSFFHPVWALTLRSQSCQEGLLNAEMRPSSLVCGYCVRRSGDKPILHMLPCLCSQLSFPSTSCPHFWALFLPFRRYVEPGFKLSLNWAWLLLISSPVTSHAWYSLFGCLHKSFHAARISDCSLCLLCGLVLLFMEDLLVREPYKWICPLHL